MSVLPLPLNARHLAQQGLIKCLIIEGISGSSKDLLALTWLPVKLCLPGESGTYHTGQRWSSLQESQPSLGKFSGHSDICKKRKMRSVVSCGQKCRQKGRKETAEEY